jgi:hypothetical protein
MQLELLRELPVQVLVVQVVEGAEVLVAEVHRETVKALGDVSHESN